MKAPVNFRPCDFSKEIQSFKLGKAYGFDGLPNECLQHLPRRTLVHLTHLLNHLSLALSLPCTLDGSESHNSVKTWQRSKISPKLSSAISPLYITGKLFQKLILRTIQKHNEESSLLYAIQLGFRADHSKTLNVYGWWITSP
jgi:hypothetical protein